MEMDLLDGPGCAYVNYDDGLPKKIRVTGVCTRCGNCASGHRPRRCTVKRGYLCLGFCGYCARGDGFYSHLVPVLRAPTFYFKEEQLREGGPGHKSGQFYINPPPAATNRGSTTSSSSRLVTSSLPTHS